MKISLLFVVILCLNFSLKAQTTYIPDDEFEQHLIWLGLDSGPLDDYVLTENIDTLTYLQSLYQVQDLTGIEDFAALEYLKIVSSLLTSIDLSNNPNLTYLYVDDTDSLTTLNITQNLRLKHLELFQTQLETINITHNDSLLHLSLIQHPNMDSVNTSNNLLLERIFTLGTNVYLDVTNNLNLEHIQFHSDYPTLDLSQNLKLKSVWADFGQLETLDLSHNTMLNSVRVSHNKLTYINLKNGNNSNIIDTDFDIQSNPNLTCILVDDVDFSNQNWFQLDAQSYFSNSCAAEIEKDETIVMSISPNPMTNFVNISVSQKSTYMMVSIEGKQVKEGVLYSGKNYINTDNLNTGIYMINVKANTNFQTYKIIKH